MLCGTAHPTHFHGRLRIVVGPLAAVSGVWYHQDDIWPYVAQLS